MDINNMATNILPSRQINTQVVARLKIEGIHRWKLCPIEEVSFLKTYHRHIFFINAYHDVNHNDRDIEFIQLSHQIQTYLTDKYFDPIYNCLFFDDMSCEMIATELLQHFMLDKIEVNEDGDGGAIITRK